MPHAHPFVPMVLACELIENHGYQLRDGRVRIQLGSIDLLDGTPILDIKPYLPFADSLPEAKGGFAAVIPGKATEVLFSHCAEAQLEELEATMPTLRSFIIAVLRQDPRPAWRIREDDDKQYGMNLYDINIKWQFQDEAIIVIRIDKIETLNS